MSKNLVIVESPAKAKTIESYLGKDFQVLSSVGHIRKDTKVDVANNFTVTYEIDEGHKKIVNELKKAAKSADIIWLATDEDREGESISWHLMEVLNLPASTHRITFHEITKSALESAIKNPRTVDMAMVSSQQARQTLDMLVGFDLSGVVRRKVPGAISAGRVQSPALRLVVEREREIENFISKFSFKVTGDFIDPSDPASTFSATLEKPAPTTESEAEQLLQSLAGSIFTVHSLEQSDSEKSAPIPFTTATLQIEASSKLGFSAKTTMSAAQSLYQSGHITYHRTDSVNLSSQALASIASYIKSTYGENYLKTRNFKTKSKSAQEAHEAIRPTNIALPLTGRTEYEKKLYKLIHSRTLATQMANAKTAKTTIKLIPSTNPALIFIAKGEVVIFDGFLKVYGKSKDLILPTLKIDDTINFARITARQTFAKPPARYTEGSLVKKLEELGIGRPSTYASIMSAIQARGYVIKGDSEGESRDIIEITLDNTASTTIRNLVSEKTGANKGKLLPTPSGELISDFLVDHFNQIVDYSFTADIEKKLDLIAEKKLERIKMLEDFYHPFSRLVVASGNVDRYNSARELGKDPTTGLPIFAKIGKNGGFIQLGENEKSTGEKPRFAPLPPRTTVKTVTFEQAIKQLELPALPRSLGEVGGIEIIAASGPFGPYLKAGKYNIPLGKLDPYTIDFNTARSLYQEKLDSIIADWGDIAIIHGAYGPYIKGPGRRNFIKIPKDQDPSTITEATARELIAAKTPKSTGKTTKSAKSTRKTAKTAKKPSSSIKKSSAKSTKKSSFKSTKNASAKPQTSKK